MLELLALINSGADESFLDTTLVKQLGLPTELLDEPLEANTLDGRLLARVTTRTSLTLNVLHFLLFALPTYLWFWGTPGLLYTTRTLTGPQLL